MFPTVEPFKSFILEQDMKADDTFTVGKSLKHLMSNEMVEITILISWLSRAVSGHGIRLDRTIIKHLDKTILIFSC